MAFSFSMTSITWSRLRGTMVYELNAWSEMGIWVMGHGGSVHRYGSRVVVTPITHHPSPITPILISDDPSDVLRELTLHTAKVCSGLRSCNLLVVNRMGIFWVPTRKPLQEHLDSSRRNALYGMSLAHVIGCNYSAP